MGNASRTGRVRRWLSYGSNEEVEPGGPTTLATSAKLEDVSYEVPMSIWTAAVLIPVLQEWDSFQKVYMTIILYSYCVLTAFLQLGILYVLHQVVLGFIDDLESSEACSSLSHVGLPVCLTIFEIVVVKDVYDAVELAQYVQNLPSGSAPLMYDADKDSNRLSVAGGGLNFFHTAAAWVCVVLQIAIDVVIAFLGGAHLRMQPDNNELILNTVGMLFIIEIDAIVFLFFLPKVYQKLILSLPPVTETYLDLQGKVGGGKVSKVSIWLVLQQIIKVFLVFATVATLLTVLPTCGQVYDGTGILGKQLGSKRNR